MAAPEDVTERSRRTALRCCVPLALLSVASALLSPFCQQQAEAFNAPQPIKHIDLFRLNASGPEAPMGSLGTGSGSTTNSGSSTGSGIDTTGSGNTAGSSAQQPGVQTGPILTIKQALDEGLVKSPRAAALRAQLDISKALYAQATQMPNPQMVVEQAPIAEQTFRTGTQQTIEPPWKIAFRLLSAKRQVKETKLEILHSLWLFRNDVRRAFTEMVVAQETYRILSELYQLADKLLEVTRARYQTGDVPELDVLKARLATSQTQIELQQGARRIIRAQQQLNVAVGNQVEQPISVPKLPKFQLHAEKTELLPDFSRPVPPMREFLDLALSSRLELKIDKQQISLNQAKLYSAVGNILPNVTANNGQSATGNPPTGPKLLGFYVVLNVELPFFTYSQGDIARLKATIRQFQAQYRAHENIIIGEVSSAYNNLLAARQRIKEYQEHVLADSEEVARLARLSYESGQSDITATLLAQQANVQIQRSYLDAIAAYQQAFTDLEQAVGEPLE